MVDTQLLAACVLLAAGTYFIRYLGTSNADTDRSERFDRILDQAVAVLLASVAVTSTVYDGSELADWSRTAGVLAGAAAAFLRVPLAFVVVIAGATAAVVRLVVQ